MLQILVEILFFCKIKVLRYKLQISIKYCKFLKFILNLKFIKPNKKITMLLFIIFSVYFVFNSKNVNNVKHCTGLYNECAYYNSLEEFFQAFQTKSKPNFKRLSKVYFRKLLKILHFYPYIGEEGNISFLEDSKPHIDNVTICINIFGHPYPSMKYKDKADKYFLNLREGISSNEVLFLKELMKSFQNYNYFKIFKIVRNDDLFYFISLTSLIENVWLVYLKLLTEDPYYRNDYMFVRDFITHSASFLHSVNIIYRMSLKETMYMNVFKLFALKNFKLLHIYKFAWMLSYNSILYTINDPYSNFRLSSNTQNIEYASVCGSKDVECVNLNAFDLEIKNLFDFIFKIDLDYKFKKEFKILEVSKTLDIANLQLMIRDFDKNDLLKFYTEDNLNSLPNTDKVKFRDLTYFLNSLDIKVPKSKCNLKLINKKLSFIDNEKIKEYFIDMSCVAYSDDKTKSSSFTNFLIDRLNLLNCDEPPRKRAKMA